MARFRRSPYVFFCLDDEYSLDAVSLLRGEMPEASGNARILALAILTGEVHPLARTELDALLSLPAERWIDAPLPESGVLEQLAERGLVLSESDDEPFRSLRERDESLSATQWNLHAALYHFMTRWQDVRFSETDLEDPSQVERTKAFVEQSVAEHGPAPSAFREPDRAPDLRLPGAAREDGLFRTLALRRTTRAYDQNVAMTLDQLDAVLRYAFGCHGVAQGWGDIVYIKRTSPSGGGLHPVEVYPVISNVAGVPAGIYHYNVRDHGLRLVEELGPAEARELAGSFMCGQGFFGDAHVSFILTARFDRNHWKYRHHPKAYAGILMDAAHLSQTLYLVCAELGLGAFITLAINAGDIEQRLGLDGVTEGVIAMTGCGCTAGWLSPLEQQFARPSAA